ncbi:MAG: serine/threonine-protein kinase, partial [Stellaceae bacterium]
SLQFVNQAAGEVSSDGRLPDAAEATPAGGTLGDFRIVRQVGRGGMGVVYDAVQISLARRVALKVLPFAGMLDERQLVRFKNEAQAAAALDHPNIVDVIAVGCERGVHYYAMRFIDGPTLAEVIHELRIADRGSRSAERDVRLGTPTRGASKANGEGSQESGARSQEQDGSRQKAEGSGQEEGNPQLGAGDLTNTYAPASNASNPQSEIRDPQSSAPASNPQSAIRNPQSSTLLAALSTSRSGNRRGYYRAIAALAIQVAEALDHAHELGVIHRDIKPSNLILDAHGKPWITDFGLARIVSQAEMTRTGDLLGTLRYMSPEQALGKRVPVDHRTDIYSLGVTLYELLTLRPAFDGEERQEVLRQVSFEDPRPPRRVDPRVPIELET